MSRAAQTKEQTARQLTPLHFAAAANWLEGVEILISHGADKYAQDSEGLFPLDVAIHIRSVPVVEALLRGDCSPYFRKRGFQEMRLPTSFLDAANSNNEELQNVVAGALTRHHRLAVRPYHDLAEVRDGNPTFFAETLFLAGFRDIEEYDENGLTPLMSACCWGNMSMAAFLLRNGGDPLRTHKDADLRAGHFLYYEGDQFFCHGLHSYRNGDDLCPEQEAKLLEAAFEIAEYVHSTCRCSPEGFDPIIALFQANSNENFYVKKQSFENMMGHLSLSHDNLIRRWQCLVRCEIFDRLELTHTCIRCLPTVRKFPEEDRLEIEEEEEELWVQLEEIIDEYDEWQREFNGDIVDCVGIFFDRLDLILRPTQASMRWAGFLREGDGGILGPGEGCENHWISSRGKDIIYDHKEGGRESYVLCSLFG
jgi:Ankyrin repeats (many copies)/Ankyrin repeat